jgi:ferredoxin
VKIGVDRTACEGHAQCSIVDFDIFPLDDDGFSAVGVASDVPVGEEETALRGIAACPVRALHTASD